MPTNVAGNEKQAFVRGGEAVMLLIRLEEGAGEAQVSLPSAPHVRLKGRSLCVGPNDEPLARHERNLWTYGALSFSQAVIDQPVSLRFESGAAAVHEASCHLGLRILNGRLIA